MPCPACQSSVHASSLACPDCGALLHAAELKALVQQAEDSDDPTVRLGAWRDALDLLPPGSRQASAIQKRIAADVHRLDAPASSGRFASGSVVMGALVFAFTKGKLLLLGLTKWKMMLSMFLSLGVYWTVFGWKFALGLIVSLYVHEMGHVFALQRYGIRASAPMFIPGFGAVVRLEQYPQSPGEDARIGLAGPIWGIGAAVVAASIGWAMDWPSWLAIGKVGAWLNLFNLIPVWQLDGSRGLRALGQTHRWVLLGTIGAVWAMTLDGLLLLIGGVLAYQMWAQRPPKISNPTILAQFVMILVVGGLLMLLDVPGI